MPLYEYECKQCGRHTEKRQKFSDAEITDCPYCNGPLERVISAPAISFKGSGWYKDLYSSPKPAASDSSKDAAAQNTAAQNTSSQGTSGESSSSNTSSAEAAPAKPPSPAPAAASSPAPASAPAKS